jgi:MFS family permease
MVPLREVAPWQSYLNVVATMGRSLGGPFGGWLVDAIGWRWYVYPLILILSLGGASTLTQPVIQVFPRTGPYLYSCNGALLYCILETSATTERRRLRHRSTPEQVL